ncbi:flagellin domain-containing protein [Noviherbaspirillum malthae]|uniref:flagellin domain-containing protein n=1 Tax=Noviherbaspirillum malthae TaxID=1260987 RepID=UPI00188F44F9|nr:flagellin domain-containing protein [Noviherbaspirillum malthae]
MSVINTNISSLNAQRLLKSSQNDLNTSIQRLSSGLRVNSAKDDAAGLAIATKMDSSIRGNTVAIRNANDGISMVQTAEGALTNISDALQRMRELATQSANGSNSTDERENLDTEFTQLKDEIVRIAESTTFNGLNLLSAASGAGSVAGAVSMQVGSMDAENNRIEINFTDVQDADGFSDVTGGDIKTAAKAQSAMTDIDNALKSINTMRSEFGAAQNRLGYAISNLQSSVENQSAARSRIMDTDFAAETAKLARNQILQQAGTAMLAQANSLPQNVMTLLRG